MQNKSEMFGVVARSIQWSQAVCRKLLYVCTRARQKWEPLLPTPLPEYSWQMVATDLFELGRKQHLLVVDYCSRYPEVIQLQSTTSNSVISLLKLVFAPHGVPELVRSDNGPQYASKEFADFTKNYGFEHTTSSPYFPQSNGQVERMVQTVKSILKQSSDPHLAVLSYRATPMPWCGWSSAELLMGWRIRTTVPQMRKQLTPTWSYLLELTLANAKFKQLQKKGFDQQHRVQEQSEIPDGSEVVITTDKEPIDGHVIRPAETPRSYIAETPWGEIWRNRSQLNVVHENTNKKLLPNPEPASENTTTGPRHTATRLQTGTAITPPDRLELTWRGRCGDSHVHACHVIYAHLILHHRIVTVVCNYMYLVCWHAVAYSFYILVSLCYRVES